ncbi:hypothetical protein GX48_04138 [Paracoccidioides brasiliensis]|nr:hypothetical protein GX48_04138 [Paracoccidioides brasiliensis]
MAQELDKMVKNSTSRPSARLIQPLSSTIPTELFHQILDDLTIYHILALAAHDDPYLNQRIFSFLVYRKLLATQEDFLTLNRYFKVYTDIYNLLQLPKSPVTSPLATSISTQHEPFLGPLKEYLHQEVFARLSVSTQFFSLLEPFAQNKLKISTHFVTASGLQGFWRAVLYAQERLNGTKAAQLRRMADIFETYPDLVCKATENRQTQVKNVGHIVRRLRTDAEKTSRATVLRMRKYQVKGLPSAWLFWPKLVPIVPLNRTLNLFIKGMEEFPPSPNELMSSHKLTRDNNDIVEAMGLLHINYGKQNETSSEKLPPDSKSTSSTTAYSYHKYPTPIIQDICTTIKRFANVYMPPAVRDIYPVINVPRIKYTPYFASLTARLSFPGGWLEQNVIQNDMNQRTISQLKAVKGTPHDEKEFEWLEALLNCCRYFEKLGLDC